MENERVAPEPGDLDVHVLPGEELDVRGLDQPQHQVPHVVGDRVLGHHLRDGLVIGRPERIISSS